MCNNKETFEAEMKLFGVYIPEQDASWEREGTIYILRKHFWAKQGLLYRWTKHSADYFRKNIHWGREKGPQNYTQRVDFFDHDLL